MDAGFKSIPPFGGGSEKRTSSTDLGFTSGLRLPPVPGDFPHQKSQELRVGVIFNPAEQGAGELMALFHKQGSEITVAEANLLMQRIVAQQRSRKNSQKEFSIEKLLKVLEAMREAKKA